MTNHRAQRHSRMRYAQNIMVRITHSRFNVKGQARANVLVGSRETARFCCKVVGASVNARRPDLRYSRFRARSRGLPSLGAFKHMVSERRARQNRSNRVFIAPSLQCLHQVCTKSAKSATSTLNAHFVFSWWKQMHTLCKLCKYFLCLLKFVLECKKCI